MSFQKEQLQAEEKIVVQVNQHWVILVRPFLMAFLSTLIFGAAAFYVGSRLTPLGYWLLIFLIPSYARLFWRLIARTHEEYIVTNFRVVKQEGVVSKASFDAPLDKINNVFHNQSFWGRIWNYGNVGLETASQMGTTVFRYIPNPVGFKNAVISQQQGSDSPLRPFFDSPIPATQDIPALLQKLGQLKEQGVITPEEFETKKRDLLSRM